MKKLLIAVAIVSLLVVGYSSDFFLYAKRLILNEPTTHVIQKGEYLSQIAKKYYGRADYWHELALINRAPDSDVVFPGEEIVIPSLDVIKKIRRTRWLSKVNSYVKNQEDIIAGRLHEQPVENVAVVEPAPTSVEPQASEPVVEVSEPVAEATSTEPQVATESTKKPIKSSLMLAIAGIVLVSSLIGLVLYRRKKEDKLLDLDDDINLLDDNDESEPDYNEYLRKKEKEKEVLVT